MCEIAHATVDCVDITVIACRTNRQRAKKMQNREPPEMPNKTTIRLAVMASAAILLGALAGSTYAKANTRDENCRLPDGTQRATCCSKVESTTFFGRLFGGGCTIVWRGDLGHGGQQSASTAGPMGGSGTRSSGSTGNNGNSGNGNGNGSGGNN